MNNKLDNLFVISDTHFQHAAIIKYCNRPFADVDDQTEQLIRNWNAAVKPEDTVIHCGDFILGNTISAVDVLNSLNGRIILVRGNHDTKAKIALYEQYPEKVTVKDIHYESIGGLWFIFNHFPLIHEGFSEMVMRDNSEVVYVHGHVHEKGEFFDKDHHAFNVSAEVVNYTPVPLRTIYNAVRDRFIEKGVWRSKQN